MRFDEIPSLRATPQSCLLFGLLAAIDPRMAGGAVDGVASNPFAQLINDFIYCFLRLLISFSLKQVELLCPFFRQVPHANAQKPDGLWMFRCELLEQLH